jgi:hypothetical protein
VRGVCTECWGSKGGRLFTVKKRGPHGNPVDPSESGLLDPWRQSWGCSSTILLIVGAAIVVLSGWT